MAAATVMYGARIHSTSMKVFGSGPSPIHSFVSRPREPSEKDMQRTLTIVASAASGLFTIDGTTSTETITVCAKGCRHTSIKATIDAASDGDVIQLSAQTYRESETIDTDGKAITLLGVIEDLDHPASILDGGHTQDGTDGIQVLICQSGETSTTVFENLLVKNGYDSRGGGMVNLNSNPILTDCNFCSNVNRVGYISLAGGGYDPSSTGNPPLEAPCVLGDMNFDGVVNLADRNDLNTLIGLCAADVNGDGTVDGADLAYVPGYWGLCSAP